MLNRKDGGRVYSMQNREGKWGKLGEPSRCVDSAVWMKEEKGRL